MFGPQYTTLNGIKIEKIEKLVLLRVHKSSKPQNLNKFITIILQEKMEVSVFGESHRKL